MGLGQLVSLEEELLSLYEEDVVVAFPGHVDVIIVKDSAKLTELRVAQTSEHLPALVGRLVAEVAAHDLHHGADSMQHLDLAVLGIKDRKSCSLPSDSEVYSPDVHHKGRSHQRYYPVLGQRVFKKTNLLRRPELLPAHRVSDCYRKRCLGQHHRLQRYQHSSSRKRPQLHSETLVCVRNRGYKHSLLVHVRMPVEEVDPGHPHVF